MTAHAAIAAVPKTGTPNRTLLQALLVARHAYVLGDAEDPEAFDPRGEDGSPATLVIGYRGQWFWLDEADATTGHDGVTCIVTAATGGRYKIFGVDLLITAVISKTVTDPPDPDDEDEEARPNDGDAYIVPAAASGDWATWEGSIAVWIEARREWFRILPKPGWAVAVPGAARDVVYRYDSVQADWITGNGAPIDDGTVPLSALIWDGRVENQTTTTPPASWSKGEAYIIAGSATGDWTGHDGKLAIAESDGVLANGDEFTIYAPYDGLSAYDKALKITVKWNETASAWISAAGAIVGFAHTFTQASSSGTVTNPGGNYTYSDSTAPTATVNRIVDPVAQAYAAKSTANKLRLKYRAKVTYGNTGFAAIWCVLRDSVAAAIAWDEHEHAVAQATRLVDLEFIVDPPDTDSHDYKICNFEQGASSTQRAQSFSHRLIQIEEIAP